MTFLPNNFQPTFNENILTSSQNGLSVETRDLKYSVEFTFWTSLLKVHFGLHWPLKVRIVNNGMETT